MITASGEQGAPGTPDDVLDGAGAETSPTCCGLATSPVTADDASTLAPMFKALGDPVRLQMISMIASRPEVCVCDISPAFDLSSGTISHHLKALREAGLIIGQRRGTFVYYRVVPAALRSLGSLLSVDQP